jgi:hypothetical protein
LQAFAAYRGVRMLAYPPQQVDGFDTASIRFCGFYMNFS